MPPTEFRVMFVAMDGDCVDPKSHNRSIKPLKIWLVQRNSSSHRACCNPFQQKDAKGSPRSFFTFCEASQLVLLFTLSFPVVRPCNCEDHYFILLGTWLFNVLRVTQLNEELLEDRELERQATNLDFTSLAETWDFWKFDFSGQNELAGGCGVFLWVLYTGVGWGVFDI